MLRFIALFARASTLEWEFNSLPEGVVLHELREWITEHLSWGEVQSYTNSCRVKIDHKVIRKDSSDLKIR